MVRESASSEGLLEVEYKPAYTGHKKKKAHDKHIFFLPISNVNEDKKVISEPDSYYNLETTKSI